MRHAEFFGFFGPVSGMFVFTVKTTGADETFALPLEVSGTYDFHVNWGDGNSSNITAYDHADVTHTYAIAGTYTISITGTIIGWRFNNTGDKTKIYEIKSWGPLEFVSDAYFFGCSNLTVTATDNLAALSFYAIFADNSSLTSVPLINNWDTSAITTADYAFRNTLLDQDLSGLNISSLTTAIGFLEGVTLSTPNYDATIIGWEAQAHQSNVVLHMGNSVLTLGGAAEAARDALVADGWTINDSTGEHT